MHSTRASERARTRTRERRFIRPACARTSCIRRSPVATILDQPRSVRTVRPQQAPAPFISQPASARAYVCACELVVSCSGSSHPRPFFLWRVHAHNISQSRQHGPSVYIRMACATHNARSVVIPAIRNALFPLGCSYSFQYCRWPSFETRVAATDTRTHSHTRTERKTFWHCPPGPPRSGALVSLRFRASGHANFDIYLSA